MAARRDDRAERLLDLVSFFLAAGGKPVSFEELRDAFPAYAEGNKEACLRKFERDKAELLDLGVPLEWVPAGEDGPGGYVLPRDAYYLRDLALSPDELTLLTVAGTAALQQPDFPLRADLVHALDKLLFAQPERVRGGAPPVRLHPGGGAAPGVVEALGRAVVARKNVAIRYRSFRGEITERTVSPWGLAWRRGSWFLVGHCHLRGAPRTFQAERIVALEVNPARPRQPDFEVPEGFDVAAWVGRAPWQYALHPPIDVELQLSAEVALLARGRFGDDASIERLPDGGATVRLSARNREAVLREVLALAPHARIVAPAELRAELASIAAAIARAHRGSPPPPGAVVAPPRETMQPEVRGTAVGAAPTQERIRRALFLVPWILRNRGCTVEELAAAAHLGADEVLAEIDFLRMIGRPPFSPAEMVDVDVVDGRVEVFLAQGLSRPPSLTPLEAAALDAAASAFAAEGGEALERARRKLREAVPPLTRPRFDEVAGRVRIAPAGIDPETARTIDRAIAERREIEFTYWTAARGEAARRRVRPLERVLHQGYWYLHAFCCDRRERRLFRLDRAADFVATDRRFVPRGVDEAARFGAASIHAPGASARRCLIRVAPGPWARDETVRHLGASSVRWFADGGMELELHADGAAWPVAAVLSLAGAATLIEPPDLRQRVAAIAGGVADRHAGAREG